MALGRVQISRQMYRVADLEDDLLELLPALALEEAVADSLAQAFGDFLTRESQMYQVGIDRYVDRIQELRRRRASTPADSLDDLEREVADAKGRLDSLLLRRVSILESAEEIGLDPTEEWEYVDRLLLDQAELLVGRLQIAVLDRDRSAEQLDDGERAGAPETEISTLRLRLQAAEERLEGTGQGGHRDPVSAPGRSAEPAGGHRARWRGRQRRLSRQQDTS